MCRHQPDLVWSIAVLSAVFIGMPGPKDMELKKEHVNLDNMSKGHLWQYFLGTYYKRENYIA